MGDRQIYDVNRHNSSSTEADVITASDELRDRDIFLGASRCFRTVSLETESPERRVKKFTKPPPSDTKTRQLWITSVQSLYRGMRGQKEVAEAGYSPQTARTGSRRNFVAPIHELNQTHDLQWECSRQDCGISLKSLLETSWQPTHLQLFAIITQIAAGLHQIKLAKRRCHGNLKLSNVLICADHRNLFMVWASKRWKVFLTDFRWELEGGSPTEESNDLRNLGRLLYEIVVIRRPLRDEQGERFSNADLHGVEAWEQLDIRKGDTWRKMCALLRDAVTNKLKVEDLLTIVEELDPALQVPWRPPGTFSKKLGIGISLGVLLMGVGTTFVYRQAPIILGQPTVTYIHGRQLHGCAVRSFSITRGYYQWLVNGNAVAGATNREFIVSPELLSSGSLQVAVIVQNRFGSATSHLTAQERGPGRDGGERLPTISFVRNPIRVEEGDDASLRAWVTSGAPGSLHWSEDKRILLQEAIHSGVEHELKLRGVKKRTHDRKIYSLVASNAVGLVTQNVTLLVTLRPPIIFLNTNGHTEEVIVGRECVLRVDDRFDSYTWYRDFRQEIGARSRPVAEGPEYRFQPQSTNDAAWIALVASNDDGSTTNWFRKRFVESPNFDQFPAVQSVTLESGKPYQLTKLTARGTEPISLLWYRNDVFLGVTTNSFSWSLSPETGQDLNGLYQVEATNGWGRTSRRIVARITIKPVTLLEPLKIISRSDLAPTITPAGQPGAYVQLGRPAVFPFLANRSDATYEWFRNGVRLEVRGATNRIDAVATSDAGSYEVRVAVEDQSLTNMFYLWVRVTNGLGMELVWVPGVPGMKNGAWVGRHEVSQGEFLKLMKVNPSSIHMTNDAELRNFPVERVSWRMATSFVSELTRQMPLPVRGEYRLPTEAQFQHVVGELDRTQIVSIETSRGRLETRESRPANAFGLHHILGNISEIVFVPPGTNLWAIGGGFRLPLRAGPRKYDENHKESSSASADLGMRVFYGEAAP